MVASPVKTNPYLLGYMLDNTGKRILVRVWIDDAGFILFNPVQEENFNEEIVIKP